MSRCISCDKEMDEDVERCDDCMYNLQIETMEMLDRQAWEAEFD